VEKPKREIGWRLQVSAWCNGYATEGASCIAAFETLGWSEVLSMTAVLNVRSQAVMKRLGMFHDPADHFDHPDLELDHPRQPHVICRLKKA
jgi:ribosomal-protein-alanine N-acetyltransferase